MNTLPVDPAMLVSQATQNDAIRRKLDMDSLRQRLGDTATKEEKLRESCEGFEAIFLQKMWEQMRKTVPKEGYLHSKDEEMYQSLFDIELCKKMAGAGGIGLADMLYEQLSQQLENSGRTTRPGAYRNPLEIAPAGLAAAAKDTQPEEAAPPVPVAETDKKLTAADLYTPLPEEGAEPEAPLPPARDAVNGALQELRADLGLAPKEVGVAAREWAEARARATGQTSPLLAPDASEAVAAQNQPDGTAPQAEKTPEAGPATPASGGQEAAHGHADTVAQTAGAAQTTPSSGAAAPAPSAAAEPVQAADKAGESKRLFGRRKKTPKAAATAEAEKTAPAQPRGMAPQDTLWPVGGAGGEVVSHFGWEDDKASGKRRWNSGVRIEAAPQSPVLAVLDGAVVYAGQREGYGHTIVLEHKDGFRSYYSNLEPNSVRVGDRIRHGSEFAQIAAQPPSPLKGENSASLYFELKKGEMALNPENAIQKRTVGQLAESGL